MVENVKVIDRLAWETDEEYGYRVAQYHVIHKTHDALQQIDGVTTNADHADTAAELIKAAALDLAKVAPPELYADAHKALAEGLEYYSAAMRLLKVGIQDRDAALVMEAAREISLGNTRIEAGKLLAYKGFQKAETERRNG